MMTTMNWIVSIWSTPTNSKNAHKIYKELLVSHYKAQEEQEDRGLILPRPRANYIYNSSKKTTRSQNLRLVITICWEKQLEKGLFQNKQELCTCSGKRLVRGSTRPRQQRHSHRLLGHSTASYAVKLVSDNSFQPLFLPRAVLVNECGHEINCNVEVGRPAL